MSQLLRGRKEAPSPPPFPLLLFRLDLKNFLSDLPGGTLVKNPPANVGDMGSSPGPGRSHMPRSN